MCRALTIVSSLVSSLAAGLLCAGAAGAAPEGHGGRAPAPQQTTVLLPVEGDRAIRSLDDELAEVLQSVNTAVQPSRLQLDELMLAVGCPTRAIACLQKIGRMVLADALVLGSTSVVKGGVQLRLRWFDVRSGGDIAAVSLTLPLDPDERRPLLRRALRPLFGREAPFSPPVPVDYGTLEILTPDPDVEILIDGQSRGTTPLALRFLSPRSYRVEARSAGFATWRGAATVSLGKTTRLRIEMVRERDRPRRPEGYLDAIQIHTWVIGAAGLVSWAVAAGFGAAMVSEQHAFDGIQGTMAGDLSAMEQHQAAGERDAAVANALLGVGGCLIAAAAVLSYLDYRRSTAPSPSTPAPGDRRLLLPSHASPRSRVQISPTGLSVGLHF